MIVVRFKPPGKTQWSQALVSSKVAPRSYLVEADNKFFRRNRKQLRATKEPFLGNSCEPDDDEPKPHEMPMSQSAQKATTTKEETPVPPSSQPATQPERNPDVPVTTRSGRVINPPRRFVND